MRTAALIFLLTLFGNPATSQQVYRCESAGKVSYSDEPCINAEVIDATPTAGAHSLSGTKRLSAQRQSEENRKHFDEAIKPITGMSHEQMNVERRRRKLTLEEKHECAKLDREMNDQKQDALTLYQVRKRFFELRC